MEGRELKCPECDSNDIAFMLVHPLVKQCGECLYKNDVVNFAIGDTIEIGDSLMIEVLPHISGNATKLLLYTLRLGREYAEFTRGFHPEDLVLNEARKFCGLSMPEVIEAFHEIMGIWKELTEYGALP